MSLAAASAPAADPPAPPPAPPAAVTVAGPALADPVAETRELRRASRSTRTAPAATAPAAAPPQAPRATKPAAKKPAKKVTKATTAKVTAPAPRSRRTQAAAAAPVAATDGSRASVVTSFALAQVGKPYIWGSTGPRGYDCSGLTLAAYASVGISLPRTADEIGTRGRAVPRGQWAPGDVLHWSGHVGIYLGGGKLVHAPGRGRTITVASVWGSPTARRLL